MTLHGKIYLPDSETPNECDVSIQRDFPLQNNYRYSDGSEKIWCYIQIKGGAEDFLIGKELDFHMDDLPVRYLIKMKNNNDGYILKYERY